MQVKMSAAVKMFEELNVPAAAKWNAERMKTKLERLPSMVAKDFEFETKESAKLCEAICSELEDDDPEIELVDDSKAAAPAKKGAAKEEKAPAKGKKAKAAEPEEDEADEEDEAEDDEEDEAPAKKAPKKAAGAGKSEKAAKKAPPKREAKGPGVIATIVTTLQKATAKKPVTKEDIVDVLEKAFPDREREAMAKTVQVQVPSRLEKDKGLKVMKNDKTPMGYWVEG